MIEIKDKETEIRLQIEKSINEIKAYADELKDTLFEDLKNATNRKNTILNDLCNDWVLFKHTLPVCGHFI